MSLNLSRIPKHRFIIWLVGLVVVVSVAVWSVKYGKEQAGTAATIKSFNEQAQQLISFTNLKDARGSSPYIKGKVVILNKRDGTVDPLYTSLTTDIRATNIDEIKTVVWLEWGEQLVGHYRSGAGGYVHTCTVSIIDKTIPALVATRSFRGSEPPSSKKGYGPAYGSKPDSEILSYIQSLQRK